MSHTHILIVDDELSNRILLKEMLDSYIVVEANNGMSMWNMLDTHEINLILLDVMMPEEDGFSLGKKLQNHPKYKHIPIIYVSAKVTGTDVDEGFKTGAVDYIKKPFDIQELHNRVDNAIIHNTETQELKTKVITADMVFEQIQDSIVITDSDFIIRNYNPACALLLKHSHTSLLGTYFSDVMCDKHKQPLHVNSIFQDLADAFVLTKEHETIPVSVSIQALVDEHKNELGWLCVLHNMQKQKEIEQNLINAKNKSEKANNIKSTFLARMSHEIRTPLNAILGFSDLLDSDKSTQEEKSHYIEVIKKNGAKLLSFIENLLNISSIETKKITIDTKTCRIHDLCSELTTESSVLLSYYSHEHVRFISLPNIPQDFSFETDTHKLHQALRNILDNACKFTADGEIIFSCKITESTLQFNIEDTGIGIEKDELKHIFSSFQKIEHVNSDFSQGVGLGLSISKHYIELLGGSISIESSEEKGTRIQICFPL
ncbi:MAG: response regulator [Bacteroidales bacterium]|jgi:PAS domain S-box-containing protein|nr:response regulator [Bacteroidales bacterium]